MSAPTNTGSTTVAAAMPATNEGPAPTTAAPATAQPDNTPAPTTNRKQKNFAPRKAIPDSSSRSSGISQMLSAVSDMPFYSVPHNDITYKVPCFIMFYYVISLMDNQMSRTRRFVDANPDWFPFVTQLYFAILAFYHVLKCQQIGAAISNDQNLFLEFLEDNFNVKHAKIPGPMVPFFQAIAANAGPDATYGNIVFGIPTNLASHQDRDFRFDNRLNVHLPNVIFILDQFMRYINQFAPIAPAAPGPVPANMNMADHFYFNIFGQGATNVAETRFNMGSPSARFDIQVGTSLISNFLGTSNLWRNVLPFDPANNNSTYTRGNSQQLLAFDQILGFRGFGNTVNTRFDWFGQVGRIMQPYSDFFRDSVSIGAISTSGIGVNYIITTYSAIPSTVETLAHEPSTRDIRYMPAGSLRYNILPFQGVFAVFTHTEEHLDSVTEQMGMLTQLDVNWTQVNAANAAVLLGPLRGVVSVGPLDQRIVTRSTSHFNVAATIPNLVSGYYHAPSALKFE